MANAEAPDLSLLRALGAQYRKHRDGAETARIALAAEVERLRGQVTVRDLGEAAGLSHQTIAGILNGHRQR